MKSKNVCSGVVALKIPRKLTCGNSFCNFVGFKTQISMELVKFKENNIAKVSQLLTKENLLVCFR